MASSEPVASEATETYSATQAQRLDEACLPFEAAWKAGHRPRIEEYLGAVDEREQRALLRELLHLERQWRERIGDRPGMAEYLLRFPEHRDLVEGVFHASAPEVFAPPGYQIVRELGRGGMGIVYEAIQRGLERRVALKVLLAGGPERFLAEARALAALRHPNIVQIFEVGESAGQAYFSMEKIAGGNLADRLTAGPLSPHEAATLVEVLANAVQVAHEHGIIHRDLKPGNILLDPRGTPYVSDFGLARRLEDDSGLTRPGGIVGSPSYMAPEQARGEKALTPACDVHALGAILYECLTGRPPFRAASVLDTLWQVQHNDPDPPRRFNSAVPRDLESVCLKCLQKAPEDRYVSAAALAADLRNFQRGLATDRPPSAWRRLEADLYFKNIALAEREWSAGKPQHMVQFLDACPPEQRGWEWRCLRNLARGRRLVWRDHTDVVYAIAFAPDGKFLASASDDQTVHLCHLVSTELHTCLSGHSGQLYVLRFLPPDGRYLVAANQDRHINVWDLQTGQLRTLAGHADVVVGVDCCPNGRFIVSASDDETVKVWDTRTWQVVRTLSGHTDMVNGVAFNPDGRRLASASYDQTVRIWDWTTGQTLFTLARHTGFVWTVAYSPDGRRLASGGGDNTVRLWDADNGQELQALTGHTGVVWAVAFSPDGRRIASASEDRTVRIWDPASRQEALALRGHSDTVRCVSFSPDGRYLASAGDDRTVQLWDAEDEDVDDSSLTLTLREDNAFIQCAVFSPDGRHLISASTDHALKVWDFPGGHVVRTLTGHRSLVTSVAFSPDGRYLASAGADKAVRLWEAASWREIAELRGHTDRVYGVAFSPDGSLLASGGWDRTIRLWDMTRYQEAAPRAVLEGHTNWIWCVAFSPDGRWLASASTDWTVRLWDVANARQHRVLEGHTLKVLGLAFCPAGGLLASAGGDQTVRLWHIDTGTAQGELRGHSDRVYKVVFHPDGQLLASASEDQTVKLWDVSTGQEIRTIRGHTRQVNHVAFDPSGTLLVTASDDGTVKVWNLANSRE